MNVTQLRDAHHYLNVTLATAARATQVERRTVVDRTLQSLLGVSTRTQSSGVQPLRRVRVPLNLLLPHTRASCPRTLLTRRVREVGCLPELRRGGTMAPPPLWQHACCCAHLRRCCDAARLVSVGCILRSAAHDVLAHHSCDIAMRVRPPSPLSPFHR
jgi:hypothetical protein